jgi:pantoate--beta-alanine ligase
MGAFHEGHLSLMRKARQNNDIALVSLFVNPTQFGKGEDFEKYPRDLDRDLALAESAGVDVVFAPSREEMYPRTSTELIVSGVTEKWEGTRRPGHFTGVATVVAKLFNIIEPSAAYFGLKDLQQCLVIKRMVEDMNFPLTLKFEETVRAPDGLALSSRNVYLNESERSIAPSLYRELSSIREGLLAGGKPSSMLLESSKQRLTELGFDIDYLALIDLDTTCPVSELEADAAVIVAARLGSTRLIDNVRIIIKSA